MQEHRTSDEVKRIAKTTKKAALEQRFLESWRRLFPTLPPPTMQYRFCLERKWRFDFAWPDQQLAVELDGGSFVRGGHNRGAQQAKDYEKMNSAVSLGWRVLRFNTVHMKQTDDVATFVAEVLTDAREVA